MWTCSTCIQAMSVCVGSASRHDGLPGACHEHTVMCGSLKASARQRTHTAHAYAPLAICTSTSALLHAHTRDLEVAAARFVPHEINGRSNHSNWTPVDPARMGHWKLWRSWDSCRKLNGPCVTLAQVKTRNTHTVAPEQRVQSCLPGCSVFPPETPRTNRT